MLRFLFVEIVLRVSTFVEIGFLVLGRKVQTLYFVYITCVGKRLLLLVVEDNYGSGGVKISAAGASTAATRSRQ